ncbi:MAG: hypothetical protein IJQ62_10645 [Clostridia bacterium]|nr:hypothetical protein [Clostridia bacterium]
MSGSQKYIKIVSILNIIGGAFYVLIGILGFLGKGLVGNEALIEQAGGDSSAPMAANVFLIVMIVIGLFSLVVGILGVRAANDPSKIGPVFTLAVVSLIISVVNLFVGVFGGNFSIYSLIECVPPALMTWCANNVKKQEKL